MGVGGQRHAPAAFTPGKDTVPIVQEAGWAQGLVSVGAENLAPTGIRSPDRPAHSESLYWLSYPGPMCQNIDGHKWWTSQANEQGLSGTAALTLVIFSW